MQLSYGAPLFPSTSMDLCPLYDELLPTYTMDEPIFTSNQNFSSYIDSDHEDAEIRGLENIQSLDGPDSSCILLLREKHTEGLGSFISTTTEAGLSPARSGNNHVRAKPAEDGKKDSALDDQLDFILGSVKRNKCADGSWPENQQSQRTRKSREQVTILLKELGNCVSVTNKKMKEVAAKTGLKKLQVYKWYWDFKKRTKRVDEE